ncbi:MAG: hypothetical protein GWP06_15625, partial [Actinobacteria bacterium]|nr:hypothetical protein [Actinomycetota bacterium]
MKRKNSQDEGVKNINDNAWHKTTGVQQLQRTESNTTNFTEFTEWLSNSIKQPSKTNITSRILKHHDVIVIANEPGIEELPEDSTTVNQKPEIKYISDDNMITGV